MKITDITPYIILGFSIIAGRWGAKRAEEIQKEAAAGTNLGDLYEAGRREQIKKETVKQAEDWFERLDNGLGVFMLASAASAVQSNHPFAYAASALFLLPAIAPAITTRKPDYLLALREKKDRDYFEDAFYRHIQNTYYGRDFKKPFLFWLGIASLFIPMAQQWAV